MPPDVDMFVLYEHKMWGFADFEFWGIEDLMLQILYFYLAIMLFLLQGLGSACEVIFCCLVFEGVTLT